MAISIFADFLSVLKTNFCHIPEMHLLSFQFEFRSVCWKLECRMAKKILCSTILPFLINEKSWAELEWGAEDIEDLVCKLKQND